MADISFEIAFLDPASLTPNPSNWRRHPDKQKEALAASIAEFGWLSAPIWNKQTGRLVDGHARVEQAVGFGVASIPVRVIDVPEATERRILAAFDRIGEMREVDDDRLLSLLNEARESEAGLPPGWLDDDVTEVEKRLAELQNALSEETAERESAPLEERYLVLVLCQNEREQTALLERFAEEGLECRALMS